MKKLILVTSPPACGKTFISKQLAKSLEHVVYLDKDTLIPLSRQIFSVANEEYNRSSEFFETYIRNYEYDTIIALALEALEYDDTVLINAPFTREVRSPKYMEQLRSKLQKIGAKLVVIWVVTDKEICHQRMIKRNSDRDKWKLEHWNKYIKSCNFTIPKTIENPKKEQKLLLFYNSSEEEYKKSMKKTIKILENM